jgi:hypothetical protein
MIHPHVTIMKRHVEPFISGVRKASSHLPITRSMPFGAGEFRRRDLWV